MQDVQSSAAFGKRPLASGLWQADFSCRFEQGRLLTRKESIPNGAFSTLKSFELLRPIEKAGSVIWVLPCCCHCPCVAGGWRSILVCRILPFVISSSNHHAGDWRSAAPLRGLYVVTDGRAPGGHEAMARAALAGGARIIQLRDKTLSLAQLLPLAVALRELAHRHGALFIINDRIDLALACGADGVHLGPDDLPVHIARHLMPQGIIGASCGDEEEARRAENQGADYIGAGAVFGTQTKLDAGAPIGLQKLSEIVRATRLPVAAIGGIDQSNIQSVLQAGAPMACVVSAISAARATALGDSATSDSATSDSATSDSATSDSATSDSATSDSATSDSATSDSATNNSIKSDEAAMTQAARDLVAAMSDQEESSTR